MREGKTVFGNIPDGHTRQQGVSGLVQHCYIRQAGLEVSMPPAFRSKHIILEKTVIITYSYVTEGGRCHFLKTSIGGYGDVFPSLLSREDNLVFARVVALGCVKDGVYVYLPTGILASCYSAMVFNLVTVTDTVSKRVNAFCESPMCYCSMNVVGTQALLTMLSVSYLP